MIGFFLGDSGLLRESPKKNIRGQPESDAIHASINAAPAASTTFLAIGGMRVESSAWRRSEMDDGARRVAGAEETRACHAEVSQRRGDVAHVHARERGVEAQVHSSSPTGPKWTA